MGKRAVGRMGLSGNLKVYPTVPQEHCAWCWYKDECVDDVCQCHQHDDCTDQTCIRHRAASTMTKGNVPPTRGNQQMSEAVQGTIEHLQTPRGTVSYTKKVSDGNYGGDEFFHSVQYDVVIDDVGQTIDNAEAAARIAKAVVFSQLGIASEVDENGIVREVAPPKPAPTVSAEQAAVAKTEAAFAPPASEAKPRCPKCNSSMFDNREDNAKRRAEGKNLAPDWRCSKYRQPPKGTGCDGVVWPPKDNG